MRRAAAVRSSTERTVMPESCSVSKWFGVVKVASGSSSALSAWSVSRAWPGSWPLQMSTGSRTTWSHAARRRAAAEVRMTSGEPCMPSFTVRSRSG